MLRTFRLLSRVPTFPRPPLHAPIPSGHYSKGVSSSSFPAAQHSDARIRNNDRDSVAVIIGASRGIGFALTERLVARGWKGKILATCRRKSSSGALQALCRQDAPGRIEVLELDVCDESSIEKAAAHVQQWGNGRIDLLIHAAGILHERGKMPETSLAGVQKPFLQRNLEVNLIGPVLVGKHLTPLMTTRRKSGRVCSVFAALSARVGSIADNRLGGWLSYRVAKAGQNQAVRTMAVELKRKGVVCVSLHPGTVATDLSRPFWKNVKKEQLFEVNDCANRLWDVVDGLGGDDGGRFLDYQGRDIEY